MRFLACGAKKQRSGQKQKMGEGAGRESRASGSPGPETRGEGSSRGSKVPSIPQGPREALAAERRFLEPRTSAVVAGRESAHRQPDLRSEARATRPTARPGHRPGPRRIFPQRNRPTSAPADPVGTAARVFLLGHGLGFSFESFILIPKNRIEHHVSFSDRDTVVAPNRDCGGSGGLF